MDSEEDEGSSSGMKKSIGYDYLLSMPIYSLTREKVERLAADRAAKEAELNALLGRKPKDLWRADLEEFMMAWEAFERASAAVSQMERAKTMKSLLAARGGKNSSRTTKKSTATTGKNGKKKALPSDHGIVSEPSSEGESDLGEDSDDGDFVIKGKPTNRPATILGPSSMAKTKAVLETSKRNLGTIATAADAVAPKTAGVTKATASAAPTARTLTEDEINSLPLAERINYMLNRPSAAIPVKKQSTLDAHLSLTAPGRRSSNDNGHHEDDDDEGLPPLTRISIAPASTDKTAIKRRRVAALALPSDDDE